MEQTPELRIQFAKRGDGTIVLHCLRKDGSATWQRRQKHVHFFSFHDLDHFAVEATLGFAKGFYGLVADGWDIADTEGKSARGKPPAEAILVEHIVGLLERERVGGAAPLAAADFNAQIKQMFAGGPARLLTDAELTAVRSRIEELHTQWAAVKCGATLELAFDRAGRSA